MKRKVLFGLVSVIWLLQSLHAQISPKYQALFVYNFTRYIEWPSNNAPEFVIGILGKSGIYNELQTISQGKSIGTQSIAIKKFQSVDEMSACSILFVSNEVSSKVSQLAT
jgi:hypothetical protein